MYSVCFVSVTVTVLGTDLFQCGWVGAEGDTIKLIVEGVPNEREREQLWSNRVVHCGERLGLMDIE